MNKVCQLLTALCLVALLAPAAMACDCQKSEAAAPTETAQQTPDAQTLITTPPADEAAPTAELAKPTAMERVVEAQWMSNMPDGKFHPEKFVTRADLATVLVKAFNLNKRDAVSEPDIAIPDVPKTYWAYPQIQMMLKTNTMDGYHRDERFYPNQRVNRAEGFAILAQAYGVFQFEPDTLQQVFAPYSDVSKIPGWASKAMATALHEGFVNTEAKGDTQWIRPLAPLTRGDLAFALDKYLDRLYNAPGGVAKP
jgi:hypothetical protein